VFNLQEYIFRVTSMDNLLNNEALRN